MNESNDLQNRVPLMLVLLAAVLVFLSITFTWNEEMTDSVFKAELVTAEELKEKISDSEQEFVIIDVRSRSDFLSGHLLQAQNIPVAMISRMGASFKPNLDIFIYGGESEADEVMQVAESLAVEFIGLEHEGSVFFGDESFWSEWQSLDYTVDQGIAVVMNEHSNYSQQEILSMVESFSGAGDPR